LKKAHTDSVAYVQTTGERVQRAMVHLAEGKLEQSDVSTLLQKELKLAEIEANGAKIEARRRIQEIAMRLLVLGLSLASGIEERE
jgi:hypothetical protein